MKNDNRRKAYELREQGLPIQEIASILDRSVATVKEYFDDPDRTKALAREQRLKNGQRLFRRWTDQEILDALRLFTERHGRVPTHFEWKSKERGPDYPHSNIVTRHFGGWNAALKAAKLPTRKKHERLAHRTAEELVDEIRQASIWGAAPSMAKGRMHTVASILADRGISWAEACQRAGVRPRRAKVRT